MTIRSLDASFYSPTGVRPLSLRSVLAISISLAAVASRLVWGRGWTNFLAGVIMRLFDQIPAHGATGQSNYLNRLGPLLVIRLPKTTGADVPTCSIAAQRADEP
jgi:hypothetical protein